MKAHFAVFLVVVISTAIIMGGFQRQANAANPSPGDILWAASETSEYKATGVAVDTTGAYVVGVHQFAGGSFEWRIEKRDLTTGDILFSISEQISPWGDVANSVAAGSTGFYVVGQNSVVVGSTLQVEWRIEKRDLTTGASLWNQSEYIGGSEGANGVTVDSSALYVVGYDSNNTGDFKEWRVEKRDLTTGAILWAHSEQISGITFPTDVAAGAAVDGTGLYVVGYDNNAGGSFEWRIEKRSLTDGSILWSVSENNGGSAANAVAVNNMGVYVVGYDPIGWRIEKRNPTTGATIWALSEQIRTQSGSDIANGVAVDTTGVYVVGADSITPFGQGEWRVEKRDLATGAMLWAHSEDIGPFLDEAFGAAVDSTGVYVVGSDTSGSPPVGPSFEWRVEKRNLGLAATSTSTSITSTQTVTSTIKQTTTQIVSSTTTTTLTSYTSTTTTTNVKTVYTTVTGTGTSTKTTTTSKTSSSTATTICHRCNTVVGAASASIYIPIASATITTILTTVTDSTTVTTQITQTSTLFAVSTSTVLTTTTSTIRISSSSTSSSTSTSSTSSSTTSSTSSSTTSSSSISKTTTSSSKTTKTTTGTTTTLCHRCNTPSEVTPVYVWPFYGVTMLGLVWLLARYRRMLFPRFSLTCHATSNTSTFFSLELDMRLLPRPP